MRAVPIVKLDSLTDGPTVIGTITLHEHLLDEIGAVKPNIKLAYSYRADDNKIIEFALIFVGAEEKRDKESIG
jgi:hypothetical protein